MSTSPNDGGPAFPCESNIIMNGKQATVPAQGITVRDYFAAAALSGLLANSSWELGWRETSQHAYECADEMLAESLKAKKGQS